MTDPVMSAPALLALREARETIGQISDTRDTDSHALVCRIDSILSGKPEWPEQVKELVRAARERNGHGHSDTCSRELCSDIPMKCDCGKSALAAALQPFEVKAVSDIAPITDEERKDQSASRIFYAQVSGCGRFTISAPTRRAAEWTAEQKRQWGKALNVLVWDPTLPTDFDKFTSMMADIFSNGKGVPMTLLKSRAKARKALRDEQ